MFAAGRVTGETMMRTITLEEHFVPARNFSMVRGENSASAVCGVGDKRIVEMDAAGIDMQILSSTSSASTTGVH